MLLAVVTTTARRHSGRRRGWWSQCRLVDGERASVTSSEEGRLGLHLDRVLDVLLLLQQVGLVEERQWWHHSGEHGNGLIELVVQAAESVDDEDRVGDGGVAVEVGVGETLEAVTVLARWTCCPRRDYGTLAWRMQRVEGCVVQELPMMADHAA